MGLPSRLARSRVLVTPTVLPALASPRGLYSGASALRGSLRAPTLRRDGGSRIQGVLERLKPENRPRMTIIQLQIEIPPLVKNGDAQFYRRKLRSFPPRSRPCAADACLHFLWHAAPADQPRTVEDRGLGRNALRQHRVQLTLGRPRSGQPARLAQFRTDQRAVAWWHAVARGLRGSRADLPSAVDQFAVRRQG